MNSQLTLTKIEQRIIASILLAVVILVAMDLFIDLSQGGSVGHLSVELIMGIVTTIGFFILIRSTFRAKTKLRLTQNDLQQVEREAAKWRNESKKYVDGLSNAIDAQLQRWELSPSEKEVALFLLKGLSLKEIAELRHTTEKTARSQSTAVYQKSGLAGRSEFAAFFLEDLLSPAYKLKD